MYKSAPLEPRELTASRESEIASFKMM
jgi:hypothetical protein